MGFGVYKPSSHSSSELEKRRLTAKTVTLPIREKWYNRVYIPWLFPHRRSPHSNAVQTTKYTLLNFIPKNLWEQFHRLANLYFLFIALINFIPEVEAVGKEVAYLPLVFVLIVPAIKDAYEDYQRYKCDRQVNKKLTKVFDWDLKKYVKKQWSQVCVGDFVQLSCDEEIPADILLLYSSEPNKVCFIETANLDGETNLKQREVVETTGQGSIHIHEEHYNPEDFVGELYFESPKAKIYEFSGCIQNPDGGVIGVNRNNLLLRGCVLRNTRVVAGVVVYAGHETKSLLNNSGPRAKRSKLERDINSDIIFQVGILLCVCITGAIGSGIWSSLYVGRNASFFPYTTDNLNPALEGFIRFWSFLIVHQIIIPISLYVSMEIVKVAQVYFINSDCDMYYAPTDTPFSCRALNISENLGQIQHIFSDKTGTLTENHLLFRCCSIGGVNYPHTLRAEFDNYNLGGSRLSLSSPVESGQTYSPFGKEKIEVDETLVADNTDCAMNEAYIRDAFITMAICNTVLVSRNCQCKKTLPDNENSMAKDLLRKVLSHQNSFIPKLRFLEIDDNSDGVEGGECGCVRGGGCDSGEDCGSETNVLDVKYEAESPDDLALVEAARAYGYALISRSPSQCTITTPSSGNLKFEILDLLEFDSERRCMSIITRLEGTGKITLFTKGADSVVCSNLSQSYSPGRNNLVVNGVGEYGVNEAPMLNRNRDSSTEHGIYEHWNQGDDECSMLTSTQTHLDLYARLGLRTLCLAKRELSEDEYKCWVRERQVAKQSIENRDKLLFQSACNIEKNLQLLGATGVEDRLQEGVPEAIQGLQEAGIKLWVLTGDKQETAINIGYSSRLIEPHMEIIQLNAHSKEHCRAELERCQSELVSHNQAEEDRNSLGSRESIIDSIPLIRTVYHKAHKEGKKERQVQDKALLTDGETLRLLSLEPSLQKMFLGVAQQCRSVLCCRVAPLQKAMVVNIVKTNLHEMTLAIGDGANDASMIQKADVGVGIIGREGRQAAMASDFAMARFKFLVKLLLVHGHWCYSRLARMMLYFFYKNLMYALLLFWFQFFNGFSSSVPINSLNLIIFNLIYTSLPILVVSVADQDLKAGQLMEDKSLYKQGKDSEVYTKRKFLFAVANGIYQSLVVYFVAYGAYYNSDVGLEEFGFVLCLSAIVVVSLHLAVDIYHWTAFHHVALWGSVLVAFAFNYAYCGIATLQEFTDVYGVMQEASKRIIFWLVLIITPVIALFPKVVAKATEQELYPSAVLRARAEEKQNTRRKQMQFKRFGIGHKSNCEETDV